MFEFITKLFSPSSKRQETESNTVSDSSPPNQLEVIHNLLDELTLTLETTRSTQLDLQLYHQIFNLILSIHHYTNTELTRWQMLKGSNFDQRYIQEIKSARMSIQYPESAKKQDIEALLPFPTTEMLITKVAAYKALNKVEGYDDLLKCASLYETRTDVLVSLSDDEKKELIGLLGTEDYAKKFEFSLVQYVTEALKDKDSFNHYVENILTYTDVDFMKRVASITLPNSPPRSAPMEIKGASPRERPNDNASVYDKNVLLVNLYKPNIKDSYHIPFEEDATFKKASTKKVIILDKIKH